MILIHGFPLNRRLWEHQVKALARAGFRVVAPDLPGHGASPPLEGVATMERMAQAVLGLADALRLERFVVVGHSMGGYVALAVLAMAPERITGIALCHSRAQADDEAGRRGRVELADAVRKTGTRKLVDVMIGKMFAESSIEAKPAMVDRTTNWILSTSVDGATGALLAMRSRPDRTELLHQTRKPLLVLAGAEDPIIPLDEVRTLSQTVPGAHLVVIEGSAHMSMMERPAAFHAALLGWLEGLQAVASTDAA